MEAADNDKATTLAQKSASKLAIFGGSFPVANPKAFSAVDLKLLKVLCWFIQTYDRIMLQNVRPRLVVDVPRNDAEKRVKLSRTPLILKHLRNNWIWHCKNGQEVTQFEGNLEDGNVSLEYCKIRAICTKAAPIR